jgi:hypothetical protein
VPGRSAFDYAVVRVVPDVAREEFVNVGVILHARVAGFLGCELALDVDRLRALAAGVDVASVERHLDAFRGVCAGDPDAGPIARLPVAERFRWLVAPRSTVIQTSAVHGGVCDDPAEALAELFVRRVGVRPRS